MSTVFEQHEGLNSWAEFVIEVAQKVAPELATKPAYVVRMAMANTRGASGPGFDETFQNEIRAAQKWHGRGPCVIVDDRENYRAHYGIATEMGLDVTTADMFAKRGVAGLVLHEFAHAIRDDEMGTSPPIGGEADLAQRRFEVWANKPRKIQARIPRRPSPLHTTTRSFFARRYTCRPERQNTFPVCGPPMQWTVSNTVYRQPPTTPRRWPANSKKPVRFDRQSMRHRQRRLPPFGKATLADGMPV